jgi:hypothetical protein
LEDLGHATAATLSISHSRPGAAIIGLLIAPLTRRATSIGNCAGSRPGPKGVPELGGCG